MAFDQYYNFPEDVPAGATRTYVTDFTNNKATVLNDYYIYMEVYHDGELISKNWQPNYVRYNPENYPDITSSCTSEITESDTGLNEELSCPAPSSTVFIEKTTNGDLFDIEATGGSITVWWTGEKDGNEGYYIKGTATSYELIYTIMRVIEMPAVNYNVILIAVLVIISSVFLVSERERKQRP